MPDLCSPKHQWTTYWINLLYRSQTTRKYQKRSVLRGPYGGYHSSHTMWCATIRRQHQLPTSPLLIDGCSITPVQSARDLGMYVDCDLLMQRHVQRTVSRCFTALRQLCQIRRSVPSATPQMLVVALVHSRLDYGNGVQLVGLPAYLMPYSSRFWMWRPKWSTAWGPATT